jgi:pyruvate ferredoxin oxidoreductase delta subunit
MSKESWKELTIGTINLNAGNSVSNLTGTWRSGQKPEFIFAIQVKDGEVKGIDYDYCTGCGMCSVECPTKEKAIIMVKEEVKLAEGGGK